MDGDLDVASVPGAGSAFVLALPGPTPVDPSAVAAVLARALADEEIGLEERSVRQAIVAGRTGRQPADREAALGPAAERPAGARLRALPGLRTETTSRA
jgi:hypothetical protein